MTRLDLTVRRFSSLLLLLLAGVCVEALSILGDTDRYLKPDSFGGAINSASTATSDAHAGLRFEVNRGQAAAGIDYLSHGAGYLLSLTSTEATLSLQMPVTKPSDRIKHGRRLNHTFATRSLSSEESANPAAVTLRLRLVNSNPHARVAGLDALPGRINYASVDDRSKWHTGIATYSRVKYEAVYRGIDLIYYGNSQRQLEYDFQVAPGADPASIVMSYDGVIAHPTIEASGDLVLRTAKGEIRQRKPFIYQEMASHRQLISGDYTLQGENKVGFRLSYYDASRPLIIDPSITYSSFMGGVGDPDGGDKDSGNDIAVDTMGNIYAIGETNSLGRYDTDVYIRKFDPSGSKLLYATYIDCYQTNDLGSAIAVDSAGNAYVTGECGDGQLGDGLGALVAKLSPAGVPLYEVAFGANGPYSTDEGNGIAVDDAGNAYVVGTTGGLGTPFPTTPGAFQETFAGGLEDAFVVKINPQGNAFVYSTLLGGIGSDEGFDIAIRKVGGVYHAYVTGETSLAADFPTTPGSFQPNFGGAADVFVVQLNDTGINLVYSTYLGGDGLDEGYGIDVDASGNAYLTGITSEEPSSGGTFPIVNAFQPIYGGDGGATPAESNAFVAKLNATGTALVYSSYMGGGGYGLGDQGNSIKVDAVGNAYLSGSTSTRTDIFTGAAFPILNAFQPHPGGGDSSSFPDAFVAKLTPAGALVFSSYLGGSNWDDGNSLALGVAGTAYANNIYLTGSTQSVDFPVTLNAFQKTLSGGGCGLPWWCPDAFVTKVSNVVSSPTATPTRTATQTASRTPTASATKTPTPTAAGTPSGSGFGVLSMPSPTQTRTAISTQSVTKTATPTPTATAATTTPAATRLRREPRPRLQHQPHRGRLLELQMRHRQISSDNATKAKDSESPVCAVESRANKVSLRSTG